MKPIDIIKKEIRRQLTVAEKSSSTIDYVCEEIETRYNRHLFFRANDLIVDGVKLGKKLEK